MFNKHLFVSSNPGLRRARTGWLLLSLVAFACVKAQPLVDPDNPEVTPPRAEGDRSTPTPAPTPSPSPTVAPGGSPTPVPTPVGVTIAYNPDTKALFTQDCVRCHSGSRPDAGYNMSTYAGVMRQASAGSSSGKLISTTRSNGSMYRYWSGDRAARADTVLKWIVNNRAAENR